MNAIKLLRPKLLFGLLLAASLVAACGTARRSEPIAGPLPLTEPELAAGRQVFLQRCHQCHPGGEGGLGPGLNDKPLPDFLIRLQVRKGLGVMPAFSEEQISSTELNDLLRYMRHLRRHPADDAPAGS